MAGKKIDDDRIIYVGHVKHEDLRPDDLNANDGTERGTAALQYSLEQFGAGRSILLDKDNRVIAGNKTLEEAAQLGIPVSIIETDGHTLIAVRRRDMSLDDPQGRLLGLADNEVGALNLSWNVQVLGELDARPDLDLTMAGFSKIELEDIRASLDSPLASSGGGTGDDDDKDAYKEQYGVIVVCDDEDHQREVFERLQNEGYTVKIVVT